MAQHKEYSEKDLEFRKMLLASRGYMTQEQVSKASGLSIRTISKIENCSDVTMESFLKYVNGLGGKIRIDFGK